MTVETLEAELPDRDKETPVTLREPGSPAPSPEKPRDQRKADTMKCPIDNSELVISSRDGVEIDYCPQCRGVWLDRGELDKIIERSMQHTAPQPVADAPRMPPQREPDRMASSGRRHDDDDDDDRYRDRDGRPYRKKRSSFLSELFDF